MPTVATAAERHVRGAYISYLETELGRVERERDREAVLRETSERQAAELGHLVRQMQTQPSYRLAQGLARLARRWGPIRRLGRAIRSRLRTAG
jgi:hypothetical protein